MLHLSVFWSLWFLVSEFTLQKSESDISETNGESIDVFGDISNFYQILRNQIVPSVHVDVV